MVSCGLRCALMGGHSGAVRMGGNSIPPKPITTFQVVLFSGLPEVVQAPHRRGASAVPTYKLAVRADPTMTAAYRR